VPDSAAVAGRHLGGRTRDQASRSPRLRSDPREEEVLALAAVGRPSRDIAAELFISETVRNHLEHLYATAGVSNRASASRFAVQHGIVKTSTGAGG